MAMNKNGKIKGKFNIIDCLVILLLAAVVVGIVVRYGSKMTTAVKSDEEFRYVVRIEGVKAETVNALQQKGKITDKRSEMDLGEIVEISEAEPTRSNAETADGQIVQAPQPERYTVEVTVKTKGKESDNSYITADSNELSAGSVIDIYSKYVHTSGRIISVEKTGR